MTKYTLPEDLANKKILLCKEEPFFLSPEGEGPFTGRLCSWMRVSSCNLSCAWLNLDGSVTLCDTPYTSHKPSRYIVTAQEAMDNLTAHKAKIISISGGEPFQSETTIALVDHLVDNGFQVKIETNGTIFRECKATLISMSPKLQSSSAGLLSLSDPQYHKQDTNNFLNTTDFALRARQYKTTYERHEAKRYNLDSMKKFLDFYQDRVIFKFVVNQESDIQEIFKYYIEPMGIPHSQVWLMAQGITTEQLNEKAQWCIEQCKQHGFHYSDRLHIRIYGNKAGV